MQSPEQIGARGDGLRIQLNRWAGGAKTLFCIHGLTANSRSWDLWANALTPQHALVAMDLRGRGLSDQPDNGYGIGQHVEDIRRVLEDQRIEQPIICGHSLGAYIAAAFAARYPEVPAGLILVDGGGALTPEQWQAIEPAIKPALARLEKIFPSFEDYVAPLKLLPNFQPWTLFYENYFRYEIEPTADGGVRARTRMAHIREEQQHLIREDMHRHYGRIQCPTLILRATDGLLSQDDLILPPAVAETMVNAIAHARSVDLPGANHYSILFKDGTAYHPALQDFIAAI